MTVFSEYRGKLFVTNRECSWSDRDDHVTLFLDARKLNEYLARDRFSWAENRAVPGRADFKIEKYEYWLSALLDQREIEIPVMIGPPGGDLRVLSGRHRIMAMMDSGFEKVPVRAPLHCGDALGPLH